MSVNLLVVILLILLVVASIWGIINDKRKRGSFKYGIKRAINNIWPSLCMLWALVAIVLVVVVTAQPMQAAILRVSIEIRVFVDVVMSIFYLVSLVALYWVIIRLAFKPFIIYRGMEIEWDKEDRVKNKEKMLRWFPFTKKFVKGKSEG
jgi:hypothetical protein